MKIGIITFHAAYNYGAVLQTYALQSYLQSLGNSVQIVDYRPRSICRHYRIFLMPRLSGLSLFRKVKRLAGWGLHLPIQIILFLPRLKRRTNFLRFFANNFCLTKTIAPGQCSILKDFDALFFGSDQVWNTKMLEGNDPVFLGDFQTKARKIAYAASAGAASCEVAEDARFVNSISAFYRISVREKNFAEALEKVLRKPVPIVLDPTLLRGAEVWDKFSRPTAGNKKYVLVYEVLAVDGIDEVAEGVARQLDAAVIRLWSGFSLRHIMDSKTNRMHASPEEFVDLFKNAACVVTSSFHGTAFSLIFRRPFYYIGNFDKAENRPRQIIEALRLSHRIITDRTVPVFSEIDFSEADEVLSELQTSSRAFIDEALRNDGETK